ncbi:hypothetical protein [Nocardia sp. NPDC057353]|uniref:hypothetical protein n=1 Tax=Nocardia sp. NPDC057353 TaxID=3346104 RepID=UPI003638B96E
MNDEYADNDRPETGSDAPPKWRPVPPGDDSLMLDTPVGTPIPPPPVAPEVMSPRVEVTPTGSITISEGPGSTRSTIAEVTGDTFYVDLNRIAAAVRESQENGGARPTDPDKRIYVGRDGELLMGNEVAGGTRIAEVAGDTFYSAVRLADEREFVRSNMPRDTVAVSDGEFQGWHYSITNEFGDTYSLFLYFHAGLGVYRVALVAPRLGGEVDAHGCHLFSDGTLCLTEATGSGYSSMAETYAKSAIWTRGASCYRRGHGFVFNTGQ